MPLQLSGMDALLKDFYEGAVREQLNNEIPLFRLLSESDRPWSGRRVTYPAHTGRNVGVGSRTEGATLPTGGSQEHQQVIVTATYFYARGRISGQTMAAGKHAFAEALSSEMDGLVNDAKVDLGRQCWGTGDGRLAQFGATATADASAITLFNRFAESGQPGARYLNQSQNITVGTVANPSASTDTYVVSSISISQNPATTTDTVQVTGSLAAGTSESTSFVFNQGAGGCGVEAMGLQGIIDDFTTTNMWGSNAFFGSALFSVNRATVQRWNAIILENSQTKRIIDSTLIQSAFDQIDIETGMEPNLIMGHHGVVRQFLDSVASDRRYVTSGTPAFDGGFRSLSYNGVQVEVDRFAPYNNLLVMNRSALRKFILKPIGFADQDGAILSRVANTDDWDFWLSTYFNISVDGNMKSMCFIRDIEQD